VIVLTFNFDECRLKILTHTFKYIFEFSNHILIQHISSIFRNKHQMNMEKKDTMSSVSDVRKCPRQNGFFAIALGHQ
jgi:hypothetical protein